MTKMRMHMNSGLPVCFIGLIHTGIGIDVSQYLVEPQKVDLAKLGISFVLGVPVVDRAFLLLFNLQATTVGLYAVSFFRE